MKKLIQRRMIWLALLMLWVGMIISIASYRGHDEQPVYEATSQDITIEVGDPVEDYPSLVVAGSPGENFFVSFRLEREQARSETLDILKELLENPQSDDDIKKRAQEKILAMSDRIEKEKEIESLIRARGYPEALAFLHDDAIDIIIKTEGLEREDVARIGDIVAKSTGLSFSNVTIIEKKIGDQG